MYKHIKHIYLDNIECNLMINILYQYIKQEYEKLTSPII